MRMRAWIRLHRGDHVMVRARAPTTRKCALASCGVAFTPPAVERYRQAYCCREHSMAARNAKRRNRNCAHCGKELLTGEPRRFCDRECRRAYVEERRGKRGNRVIEPVAVLLPAGCNPVPLRLSELPVAYGEIARKVFCRRMERCLSYAVSKKWGGLSCLECDIDEPEKPDSGDRDGSWPWG